MAVNGVQMMLKSFGIDPEVIKKELTGVLTGAQTAVTTEVDKLRADIKNVSAQCNRLELMLSALLKHENIGYGGGLDTRISDVEHTGDADPVLIAALDAAD